MMFTIVGTVFLSVLFVFIWIMGYEKGKQDERELRQFMMEILSGEEDKR